MSQPICSVCGDPIVEGQARNGLIGSHWDCTPDGLKPTNQDVLDVVVENLDRMFENLENLINKL